MGRGQIISGGSGGLYNVKLIYAYRSRVEQKITNAQQQITALQNQVSTLTSQINSEPDPLKREPLIMRRTAINLQITSLQKQIQYFEENMPADPTVSAYCMDLTEDLTGYVGTAEIPGEKVTVLVRPGYSGRATYLGSRDGQLMPPIAGEPNQVLFNWMLLPGWQRHKPIYRIGTIVTGSIDRGANTCSVCLEAAYSTQQSLPAVHGLAISDCGVPSGFTTQINDFCSRNPGHPFCTNTEEGGDIYLSDGMLADLQAVNSYVNNNYGRGDDASGWRIGDHWDVMSPGGSGDCEDFVFTKMQRLVSVYGWNPRDLKLVTSYTREGIGHAMLGVRSSNRGLMLLDVNYDQVVASSRLPYRVDKIALTKDEWSSYTRRLDAVPVEYMQCNAWAFEDGDRVVVQFTSQDWAQPKVVGFADGPQACAFKFYFLCQFTLNCAAGGQIVYDIASDSFRNMGQMMDPEFRDRAAGAVVGSNIHVAGGYASRCSGGSPVEVGTVADHDIFNTGTEAWSSAANIPNARTGLMGAGVGGKAYFFGGFSQQHNAKQTVNDTGDCGERVFSWTSFMSAIGPFFNQCSEFDPVAAAWTAKTAITASKAMLQPFTIAQLIYAAGGVVGQVDDTQNMATCTETGGGTHSYTDLEDQYQFTDDARRYSPLGDAWAAIAGLSAERAFHAAANFEAAGYVFGGRSYGSLTVDDIEVADSLDGYDQHQTFSAAKFFPATGAWSSIAKLPIAAPDYTPPDNMPAAGSVDGIYVHVYANNFTGSGEYPLFKYSPSGDSYLGVGGIDALKGVNDDRGIAGSVGAIL